MADMEESIKKEAEANGTRKAKKLKKTIFLFSIGIGGVLLLLILTFMAYDNFSGTGSVTGNAVSSVASTQVSTVQPTAPETIRDVYLDPNGDSANTKVEPGTRQELSPAPTSDAPYEVRCSRGLGNGSFVHVECVDGQADYFYLHNKTGQQLHVQWRPVPFNYHS